ncbi:sensor histidine kinase [Nocardia sp. NPDC051570]|uniref:sensor histidine kinase n=1 Tax=Nocardia sp. NPDC051570 TaxID=3364324 RepID=UPI0037B58A62
MRTVSLRRRVTLTAAVVSGIALVVVALLVHSLFVVVVHRGENAVLTDRLQLARQLAQEGVPATELMSRVDNRSIRARLRLADGREYGGLGTRHGTDETVTRRVMLTGTGEVNRAELTMQVDTPLLARVQSRLGWVLIGAITAAIAVITGGLWFGVRRALAPLDSMTRLAREIARGGRGRRLSPERTDTELGRTASAFDEMLDALEGAEARAQASERQLRGFVADAAHELRTPVAGIRAVAEAVLHQPADTDPAERERLHLLLVREAHRAGRLVDDLLDMARIDAGLQLRTEPVDLYELARTHLDRARMLHPDIDFRLDGDPVTVTADPERLGQILVNLLDNAGQAMAEDTERTITVHIGRAGDAAVLGVRDLGPGVPAADRERVFDRLVRLDPARARRSEGSGLGLAIARGIARAHGGDLVCATPPDAGPGALFELKIG